MRAADQVADFVAKALAEGRSREDIAAALLAAGWTALEIDAAQAAWDVAGFVSPVPRPRPHISAREAFFHAILFTALVASSWFIIDLGFALIDHWLPDLDGRTHYYDHWSVRWDIAALAVSMSAFLLLDQISLRGLRRDAGRLRSSVRKWFGYIMLLLAALVLAGDLMAALFTFLNGAFSTAVAARVALVLVAAGLIFGYFLSELRESGPSSWAKTELIARVGMVLLVVALLGAAIAEVGGPAAAQRERRDMARLDDLMDLAREVGCAADLNSGVLPQTIAVNAACDPATRFADPFTNASYDYVPLSDQTFKVCAAFERLDILVQMDLYGANQIDGATGCLTERYFPPKVQQN